MCTVTVSGSIAAVTQARIGNVQTDSLFAIAQSAAMTNRRVDSAAIAAGRAAVRLAADEAAVREREEG